MAKRGIHLTTRRNRAERPQTVLGEKRRGPALVTPPIVETSVAELEDGTIVEMIEDPDIASGTALAVYKGGNVHYMQQVKSKKAILVPFPRSSEIVKNVQLPSGVEPYESPKSLLLQMRLIFDQCVELPGMYSFLLANFVLSTWVIERLPAFPYVAIVGLPESGKTILLKILGLLCRRSILTADITSAAFYDVCDQLSPTLLIDETATARNASNLYHLLNAGYTPGMTALRRGRSFKAHGARVMSWIELPENAALNSRCIVIPLCETERTDLKKPTDFQILKAADHLRKQLLQFRFERLNSMTLPRIQGQACLRSRTRDLFEALALPSSDPIIGEELARIFAILQEQNREPLSPHQTAVLRTLFRWVHTIRHQTRNHLSAVGDLAGMVNRDLKLRRECFRVSPRKVGAILTSFGMINKRRTRWGWVVFFDRREEEKIHRLVFRHGLDNSYDDPLHPPVDRTNCFLSSSCCEFCKPYWGRKEKPENKGDGSCIDA